MKKLILLLVLCLSFSSLFAADDELDSKDGTQVYPLGDDVNLVTTLKFSYGKHSVVTKSVFPQLECDNESYRVDSFNQLVNDIIVQEVGGFQSQVDQYLAHHQLAKSQGKSDLFIDYDTSALRNGKNHILSIRFSIQGNIAGKRLPYHYHRVINYDLTQGQIFELSDLFEPGQPFLEVIAGYSQKVLSQRFKGAIIAEGLAPQLNNFRNWNIKSNGLLITFEESQVAPSVYGAQSVLIPFSVLRPLAASDSPIATCFKQNRTCGRNHLLTGGFIDEALNTHYGKYDKIFT